MTLDNGYVAMAPPYIRLTQPWVISGTQTGVEVACRPMSRWPLLTGKDMIMHWQLHYSVSASATNRAFDANEFISESSGLYQRLFSLGEHMNIISRLRLGTIYYMCSPRGNNLWYSPLDSEIKHHYFDNSTQNNQFYADLFGQFLD